MISLLFILPLLNPYLVTLSATLLATYLHRSMRSLTAFHQPAVISLLCMISILMYRNPHSEAHCMDPPNEPPAHNWKLIQGRGTAPDISEHFSVFPILEDGIITQHLERNYMQMLSKVRHLFFYIIIFVTSWRMAGQTNKFILDKLLFYLFCSSGLFVVILLVAMKIWVRCTLVTEHCAKDLPLLIVCLFIHTSSSRSSISCLLSQR